MTAQKFWNRNKEQLNNFSVWKRKLLEQAWQYEGFTVSSLKCRGILFNVKNIGMGRIIFANPFLIMATDWGSVVFRTHAKQESDYIGCSPSWLRSKCENPNEYHEGLWYMLQLAFAQILMKDKEEMNKKKVKRINKQLKKEEEKR